MIEDGTVLIDGLQEFVLLTAYTLGHHSAVAHDAGSLMPKIVDQGYGCLHAPQPLSFQLSVPQLLAFSVGCF